MMKIKFIAAIGGLEYAPRRWPRILRLIKEHLRLGGTINYIEKTKLTVFNKMPIGKARRMVVDHNLWLKYPDPDDPEIMLRKIPITWATLTFK